LREDGQSLQGKTELGPTVSKRGRELYLRCAVTQRKSLKRRGEASAWITGEGGEQKAEGRRHTNKITWEPKREKGEGTLMFLEDSSEERLLQNDCGSERAERRDGRYGESA